MTDLSVETASGASPTRENDFTVIEHLLENWARVIRGKRETLEKILAAVLAGGHVLLEDLPGTGKTTLARALARLIGGADFKRIQFTPDLLPYDITGVDIWDESVKDFVFRPGPVFANIVLADEINRTTPKVQAALLEAMAESQVTVGNTTRILAEPFIVIATQNPVESDGTYVLPEAQKDRFMLRLRPGYPEREAEYAIVTEDPGHKTLPELEPILDIESLRSLKASASTVHMDSRLIHATVDLAAAIRDHADVLLGVSTRGALMLTASARALALVKGRNYVVDQDIADLAVDAYAHRIRLKAGSSGAEALVRDLAARELRRISHG